ncbi:CoA pyrophosphatase [Photobacterium sp. 1_MG-2023]|uniref:CoA pyrophosphatase n=1 Tax=Photobacterium sp. 1_MG-2023 TaxID=3062646 RepID=UPI0026E2F35B|nr:CoA pyrophosphatase [Photobacterium sp. 1_MG-2023]MDO6706627.1 CoA pyrophosphatase [Photobacterium sp. 1_MG-2023]
MLAQHHLLSRFLLAQPGQYDRSHHRRIKQLLPDRSRFKPAAVMIPLVARHDGYHVILTQRARHLKHHPGQVAFPGGRYETQDGELMYTAIRETQEETGILCEKKDVLGQLPTLPTLSGYLVTPFLATVTPTYRPVIDPNEVDSLFEVPLAFLLDPRNMRTQQFIFRGKFHTIYAIPYRDYSIWGATAQIVKALSHQIWIEGSQ